MTLTELIHGVVFCVTACVLGIAFYEILCKFMKRAPETAIKLAATAVYLIVAGPAVVQNLQTHSAAPVPPPHIQKEPVVAPPLAISPQVLYPKGYKGPDMYGVSQNK